MSCSEFLPRADLHHLAESDRASLTSRIDGAVAGGDAGSGAAVAAGRPFLSGSDDGS